MHQSLSTPFTRRQTLATLGTGAASLALAACSRGPGATAALPPSDATPQVAAEALLASIADNLLALSPEGATSLGIDTGARAAERGKLSDRSAAGQQAVANTLKADIARVRAFEATGGTERIDHKTRTSLAVVESAYGVALDGFALPYGDVAVGGWRNTPYVVIQNVGAYLDVPKFLDSDHPVKTAADAEAYLSRLNAYPGVLDGETERLKAAGGQGMIAPAFLIDKAVKQMEASLADARDGGGLVESLAKRTREGKIDGNWGRARRNDHARRGRPGARTPAGRTEGAAAKGDDGRGDVGAAGRRRMVCLGAARQHHDADDPRRGPPDGPRRAGRAAWADGPDPEKAWADPGLGRRPDERAGQGSALQIPRQRRRTRRDRRVYPDLARQDPRRTAARLPHAGEGQCRGEAPAARRGTRRARGLWRRGVDRRQHSGEILDQPAHHRIAQQIFAARPDDARGDPGACVAGRICQPDAADPHDAGVQRLFAKAGRSMPSSSPTSSASTTISRSDGWAISSRSPSAPAAWSSTPACMRSAGRANRGSSFSSRKMARTRSRSRARSIAIAAGPDRRAATRSGTARSCASAGWRRRRWGRNTTCAISTMSWSRAAMSRSTCWRRMSPLMWRGRRGSSPTSSLRARRRLGEQSRAVYATLWIAVSLRSSQ